MLVVEVFDAGAAVTQPGQGEAAREAAVLALVPLAIEEHGEPVEPAEWDPILDNF